MLSRISLLFCFLCLQINISNAQGINQSEISYLALGDSYTIGTGIDSSVNWPEQLVDSLNARGFSANSPDIIAVNGWTTTDLLRAIDKSELDKDYDLVSILIGVNNQYQNKPFELYEREFVELMDLAISFAGGDTSSVFVVSIPNYGVTPFASEADTAKIRKELIRYNKYARKKAEDNNIPFINITDISEEALLHPDLLADDKLHPSELMYSRWIHRMMPIVTDIIKK